MPVYEYFCPQCSKELEILRPIQSASAHSDCPDCGGKASRLVSGFGSKTGSYLQPSGAPFRVEPGWPVSRSEGAVAATRSEPFITPPVEDQQALSSGDMSWLLEWDPNGSNFWFIRDWGIASVLRYLREYTDIEPAEKAPLIEDSIAAMSTEEPPGVAPELDQQIESPTVTTWPDEPTAEPRVPAEPDAASASEPMAASKTPWFDSQAAEPATVAGTETQAPGQPSRALSQRWLPASYYGWLMLLAACTATIVVAIVWMVATAT